LFAELVFMAFRYKRFDLKVAALAASASCVGSLLVDALNGQIAELAPWNLALYLLARFAGSIFFAGVLAYYLAEVLEDTGVTNLVRPLSTEDFTDMD